MSRVVLIVAFIFSFLHLSAQKADSISASSGTAGFALFGNTDTTLNDYLFSIEKVFQVLNKVPVLAQPIQSIKEINQRLNEDDSALTIINARLSSDTKTLNIRNLQMFSIILKQVNRNATVYAGELDDYDSIYNAIKSEIGGLRKDTVFRRIFRDSSLRNAFRPQLIQLRTKWKKADSLMKNTHLLISKTQARNSGNLIASSEMQLQTQSMMSSTGLRVFGKESDYLWEFKEAGFGQAYSSEFQKSIQSERKITRYYFANTNNQLLLLLLCGIVFFFWVFYNYRSLDRLNKLDTLESFHFRYMNAAPVFASLIVMLNLAPLFDLDAPFIYIATVEFLLMLTLTYSFWRRLKKKLFSAWLSFLILFLIQSYSRYLNLPEYFNRWLLLILNGLCVLLGLYLLKEFNKQYKEHRFLFLTAGLYTLFNFLAIVSNLFGRTTLSQILGSTGTYAVIQTVGLLVFIESVTEAFLLQVQAGRMRKDYTSGFDHQAIASGIMRFVVFFSIIIWLIVFATNLNIFHFISSHISTVLNRARSIGSFTFTYGGIILFVLILYIAHLLQKYIGYFFGNIGDEAIFDNKGQRSRLMIVKLILLVGGFLLAVAASGLAVDKITVILGALSVGIGLGLQSIVNNFVSGIILIFDKTLNI